MDALQELQLNRIARTQHLQKGENTFGFGVMQEEGIEKAHQVGEVKVGSDGIKRVWTQLANGKFDWRRVKRDKAAQQEPAKQEGKTDDKGGEKHEHEYKIEDAEKYVDKSNASSAEKKVAKFILLGKSEEEIKAMMARAKVDSSVVDHVYKLGNKLASEATEEAKRIHKKENNWKSYGGGYTMEHAKKLAGDWGISVEEAKDAFNKFEQEFGGPVEWSKDEKYVFSQPDSGTKYKFDPDEESWEKTEEKKPEEKTDKPKQEKPKSKKPEQTKSAFSDEDVKKLTDKGYKKMSESDMASNEQEGENWADAYFKEEEFGDGGLKTTILADLGDGTYSAHTLTMGEDGKITSEVQDNILSVDEHFDGKPKFEAKVPYAISIMTNRSGDGAFDTAYRIVGKELISRLGSDNDVFDIAKLNKPEGMSDKDYELWLGKVIAGEVVLKRGAQRATKSEQLEKMKAVYQAIADSDKEKYQKERNKKYWETEKGKKRKAEIEARKAEISNEWKGFNDSVSSIAWSTILGGDDTYDDLHDKIEIKPSLGTSTEKITFSAKGERRSSEIEIRNTSDWDDMNKRHTYLEISAFNSEAQTMEHITDMMRLAERISQPKVFGEFERTLNAVHSKMTGLYKEVRSLDHELNKNY